MLGAVVITATATFVIVRAIYNREIVVGRAFIKYVNEKTESDMVKAKALVEVAKEKIETEVKTVEEDVKRAL